MEPGVGELHLRLDADCPHDRAAAGALREIVEQGRLSDPRLAAHDQHTTLSRPYIRE
jgi:hypothetical protein